MISISPEQARIYMLGRLGLNHFAFEATPDGLAALLDHLRCIQLDPLSPMGTSPDMVALARVEKYRCGGLYNLLFPGRAFEHFAKERCLMPTEAFPFYRIRSGEVPWWRMTERLNRVPREVIETIYREIEAHGPVTVADLTDHGPVEPLEWNGWKGTGNLARMAVEILWTQCRVVVAGRNNVREKCYDVPERTFGGKTHVTTGGFARWALLERVSAAGLLSRAGGPQWCLLEETRTSSLPDDLIAEGLLEEVVVEGSGRRYLAEKKFAEREFPEPDDHLRILGPLDPLIWDRKLAERIFAFEYIWEVYKPAHLRRWGWYVCPLLHRGHFVGRLEGRATPEGLVIQNIWEEPGKKIDRRALDRALRRHAKACGLIKFKRPKTFR